MLPIAKAALKEAVRKKTFIVMSIVTALYLILWAVILYYFTTSVLEDEAGRIMPVATVMITQMGLQFSSMLMCLLTIILGAGAIAAELDNGMIHAILSRPIGRAEYVLGKYVGLAVLTAAYAALLYAALLLIGGLYSLSTIVSLDISQIISGGILYLLVPLGVLCLTLYGSVSIKAVQNGLLMIFIYILGNIGGMVEMIGNVVGSKPVLSAGIFISLISPFHTLYGAAERCLLPTAGLAGDMLRGIGGLPGSGRPASAVMYIYIAIYALGFLVLAVRKFKKTDIN